MHAIRFGLSFTRILYLNMFTIPPFSILLVGIAASTPEYSISKFGNLQPTKVLFPAVGMGESVVVQFGGNGEIVSSQNHGKSFEKIQLDTGLQNAQVHPPDLTASPNSQDDNSFPQSLLLQSNSFTSEASGKPFKLFIFTKEPSRNYLSNDAGLHWSRFDLPFPLASLSKASVAFHSADPDRIILQLRVCNDKICRNDAYFTLDSFNSPVKELLQWTSQCEWGQSISSTLVTNPSKTFCTQWPTSEQHGDVAYKDVSLLTLVASENFFSNGSMTTIPLSGGVPVLGLTPNWMVGIVKSKEYHMVVTKDGSKFIRSSFNGQEESHFVAFSVLESSNSSLIVDVVSSRPYSQLPLPFGTLFVSSSDGKYFTQVLEHTNRDITTGLVDFEHIQSSIYEGVQLANTVKNWQAVESKSEFVKQLITSMSFDNCRTWKRINPPLEDSKGEKYICKPKKENSPDETCALHLHSVTTTKNVGKVFSVSSSPGTIIGVGNVGSSLLPYEESDTFISRDSGISWKELRKGPHKFENMNFGSVLVLVPDSSALVSEIFYSKNGGQDWETLTILIEDSKWIPLFTTLDANSTGLNMLMAVSKQTSNGPKFLVSVDFSTVYSRKCNSKAEESNSDLELYKLASPDNTCVLGKSSSYFRRKISADCYFPDTSFSLVPAISEPCQCSTADLECDNGYSPDPSNPSICVADGDVLDQPLDCKVGEKYNGLSGYRLIAGDLCVEGDRTKLEPVVKDCQPGHTAPPQDPSSRLTVFSDPIVLLIQVPSSKSVVILTKKGKVWKSGNEGETWSIFDIPENEAVVKIIVHETIKERIFVLTSDKMYISNDALATPALILMNTPEPFNGLGLPVLDFHPTQPDWYTFLGGARDCATSPKKCFTRAYFTKNGGSTFSDPIDSWASKCIWARDVKFQSISLADDAIFCSSRKFKNAQSPEQNPSQLFLIGSDGKGTAVVEENVLDFYVAQNVLVVAANTLSEPKLYTSTDGKKFSEASFPPSSTFVKKGMTILKSESDGVFLDITQSIDDGVEFGTLFKSNENGDFFSKSLDFTNIGSNGKVDFMKMPGIQGIAVANIVSNTKKGADKVIESRISFNDGSTWAPIVAPVSVGPKDGSACSDSEKNNCNLHIHLQSTAEAYRGMLSPFGTSNSAGLMLVVGNVGASLADYKNCNVYLTRDAGNSWQVVRKGPHLWTIADNGGLLVLVSDSTPVTSIAFSWNYGVSWADFKFSDEELNVESIVAHEGSAKIIVTGHTITGDSTTDRKPILILIDFSRLFGRNCESSDYETWKPLSHDCFFGRKISFLRRKVDSICFMQDGFQASFPSNEICQCTEEDYECDSNFFRNSVGECVLLGKDPQQPSSCVTGEKYQGVSGYRKISLSKCEKGVDLTGNVERSCNSAPANPENLVISSFVFPSVVEDFYHFKNSSVVLVKDVDRNSFLSTDGISWKMLDIGSVVSIVEDPFWPSRIFLVTTEKLWVLNDYGASISEIKVPSLPNIHLADRFLSSHPLLQDALIWIGSLDCSGDYSRCRSVLYSSFNSGSSWTEMDSYVSSCRWAWSSDFHISLQKAVICVGYLEKSGDQRSNSKPYLLRYDYADSPKATILMESGMFAIEGEYFVAAVSNPNSKTLDLKISLDAESFASAVFPDQLSVHEGYTVLESNTGNLFLSMIQSISSNAEHGTIAKSNWNGTFYRTSLEAVNVNRKGYVDFEKIEGIVGTIISNQISNVEDLSRGASKKLQTKISFDDGESWESLKAPLLDSKQMPFNCNKRGNCNNLHLHAFTERHDQRDSYSTPGATGLLIGVGNVGDHLEDFNGGDMFMSRDGGRSWIEIAKDAHMVEISDHGGLILMVNDEGPVSSVSYSLDDGRTIFSRDISKELAGGKFRIHNIVADPFGPSSSFFAFRNTRVEWYYCVG